MTPVDPSTVASWGSPEDRPERDRMRALLIGHAFMDARRAAGEGKEEHADTAWFNWVQENTAIELQWMWSRGPEYMDKNAAAYAQVVGDLILDETAKGTLPSGRWFRTDISTTYGWLFERACLEYDGWRLTKQKMQNGETQNRWTRPKG